MPPLIRLLARALLGGSCLLPVGIPKLLAQECRLPPPDTLRTVLLATIRTVPSGLSVESRQLALQELVGLLPPGSRLPLGALDVGDAFLDSTTARRMLVASSGIAFTVNPNGFIRDASLIEGARTPAGAPVDQLLQRLVRRADSARVLGGMLMGQGTGGADTVRLELRLTAFPERDDVSQPVVRLAIAYARADRRAEPVPDNPAPRYPKEALDGRLGDTVRVSFVVGEDGRPEGGSVEILRASHKEFSDAVSYVLPYYRFHPARAGDCVVRSVRVMEFTFAGGRVVSEVALDRDPPADRRPLLGVSTDDDAVPDNSGGVLGKLVMEGTESDSVDVTATRMPVARSSCTEQAKRAPPDSVRGEMFASLRSIGRRPPLDGPGIGRAMESLLPHLPSGATFPFPVDSSGVAYHIGFSRPTAQSFRVAGTITFRLHADGRIDEVRGVHRAGSLRVIAALARTIAAADSTRALAGVVQPGGRPAQMELSIGAIPVRGTVSRRLFEFEMAYRTEVPAMARQGNRAPRYPSDLQARGINGDVLVQFVVDTTGVADLRSLKVLRATDTQFAQAVADVIPQYRFYPAQLGSCKVKMYVQMPFAFRMRGHPDVPFGPVDGGFVPPMFPGSADAKPPGTP